VGRGRTHSQYKGAMRLYSYISLHIAQTAITIIRKAIIPINQHIILHSHNSYLHQYPQAEEQPD
jgi:hypothetical protein